MRLWWCQPNAAGRAIASFGIACCGVVFAGQSRQVLVGDVNGDGLVNSFDALQALKFSAGLLQPGTEAQRVQADFDADGNVTSFDALNILKMSAELKPKVALSVSDTYGVAPLVVHYNSVVSGGTAPYSYAWDFDGDGNTDSTPPDPQHTFADDGTWVTRLQVTDDAGQRVSAAVAITVDSAAPASASFVDVSSGDGWAALRWPHALLSDDELLGHNLYRRAQGETEFTQLNTVPLQEHYLDRGLTNGVLYAYELRTIDANGLESSEAISVSTTPGPRLPPVRLLSAVAGDGTVTLTWEAVPGAAGYHVRRCLGRTSEDGDRLTSAPLTGTTTTLDSQPNGQILGFYVEAIDANGDSGGGASILRLACADADDRDYDGVPDDWEQAWGTDFETPDADLDLDGDNLTNLAEYQAGTDPLYIDTDDDGLRDDTEVAGTYSSNPLLADTDGGGECDGAEVEAGLSPTNAADDAPQPPCALHLQLTDNVLRLHWFPSSTPDLDGYNIYGNFADGLGYVKCNDTPVTECGYDGIALASGILTRFRVVAVKDGVGSAKNIDTSIIAKQIDGAVGGELVLFTDRLDVPPGAFPDTRWLGIALGARVDPVATSGRTVELLPDSTIFDDPVSLSREVQLSNEFADLLQVLQLTSASGEALFRPSLTAPTGTSVLTAQITHFSPWTEGIDDGREIDGLGLTQQEDELVLSIETSGGYVADHGARFLANLCQGFSALDELQHSPHSLAHEYTTIPYLVNLLNTDVVAGRQFTVKINGEKYTLDQKLVFKTPYLVLDPDQTSVNGCTLQVETVLFNHAKGVRIVPEPTVIQKEGRTWREFVDDAVEKYRDPTVSIDYQKLGLEPGDDVQAKIKWVGNLFYPQSAETTIQPWPMGPISEDPIPAQVAVEDEPFAFRPQDFITPAAGKQLADYQYEVLSGPFGIPQGEFRSLSTPISWTPEDTTTWNGATGTFNPDTIGYYDCDYVGQKGTHHNLRPKLVIFDSAGNHCYVEFDLTVLNTADAPVIQELRANKTTVYRTRPVQLQCIYYDIDTDPADAGLNSGDEYAAGWISWTAPPGTTVTAHPAQSTYAGPGELQGWDEASWTAPDEVGTYTVTCTVTDPMDAALSDSASIQIETVTPPPPTVSISGPSSLCAGDTGTYTCNVTDQADCTWKTYTSSSYDWDGSLSGTGASKNFSRTTPATYTFSCTVRDQFGQTATASKSVTVTPSLSISLSSPASGSSTSSRLVVASGSISGQIGSTVTVYVNGRAQAMPISGGGFSGTVTLTAGSNSIYARGYGPCGYKNSNTVTVTCTAQPTKIWAQLSWDQDLADVDLHVHEPDGDHIYYSNKTGNGGGHLDRDDVDGYGPEHYQISDEAGDTVNSGNYEFNVVYYDDHGLVGNVTGRLVIYKNESPYTTKTFTLTAVDRENEIPLTTVTMP